MGYKCGFVAIIGRPNAGKSTLVNALVGEKVSIVSPKQQTTRNNILGILSEKDYQLVFIDTPGINKSNNQLDEYMQKSIKGAVTDVNAIVIAIDGTKKVGSYELDFIKKHLSNTVPTIVVVTKVDLLTHEQIFDRLQALASCGAEHIVPLSSIKNDNTDELVKVLLSYMPECKEEDKYFDDDTYTDKSMRFMASEVIREKALYLLDNEVPHGIAVDVRKYEELDNIINIEADIICEKDSHKNIIIGKQGSMLKNIGHNARVSLQKIAQKKIDLKLWVRVNKNWRENQGFLVDIGYNNKEI